MNSAGKIQPGWRPEELEAKNSVVPPRLFVDLFSRGLFLCVLVLCLNRVYPFPIAVISDQHCYMKIVCLSSPSGTLRISTHGRRNAAKPGLVSYCTHIRRSLCSEA